MPIRRKTWMLAPAKPTKRVVPEAIKTAVQTRADAFVESVLKPKYIKPPPPPEEELNYLVDIHTKWFRSYFYFESTYICPGPRAMVPSFELKFARLEY